MSLDYQDLKGNISDVISVDEFKPKSGNDEEVIVVAYYADGKPPADDLNRFIQRGYIDILDSDVSPNPDEEGRFLVFVEFERDETFPSRFDEMVLDVTNVAGKLPWKLSFNNKHLPDEYTPEMMQELILDPVEYLKKFPSEEDTPVKESIKNFLKDSFIKKLDFDDEYIIFNERVAAKLIDFGESDILVESHALDSKHVVLLDVPKEFNTLWSMIGEGYDVTQLSDNLVLTKRDSSKSLLLSDLMFVHKP